MRAQVSLTPTESKSLIAKGLVEMDIFKEALKSSIIAIHPSSTTIFIMEEIFGTKPAGKWVAGIITKKGTCISREAIEESKATTSARGWIIRYGKLQERVIPLSDILRRWIPMISL